MKFLDITFGGLSSYTILYLQYVHEEEGKKVKRIRKQGEENTKTCQRSHPVLLLLPISLAPLSVRSMVVILVIC